MRIGVDFDNTIAGYDEIFDRLARERGWLEGPRRGKAAVRAALRSRQGGDRQWQELQAEAYGPRMAGARLIDGFGEFVRQARRRGHEIAIVSHKTRHARLDPDRTDMRAAALAWMDRHGFFAADGFGLARDAVHFEDTRSAKVRRIGGLGLDCFIDDLPEVFAEPDFPADVEAILFDPHRQALAAARARWFGSWPAIREDLLERAP